jgi:hypothetical protein
MADDDTKRRAALFSAYFHAHHRGGAGAFMVSESVRPEPLGTAIPALSQDASPDAKRHQRLALGKLLGAGLHQPDRWGTHKEVLDFAAVSGIDLVNFDGDVIDGLFEQLGVPVVPGDGQLLTQPALVVGSAAFEAVAQNVVNTLAIGADCEFEHLGTAITYETSTLVTRVEVTFLVAPTDFGALSRALDPRNWPAISPDFFPQAYKVELLNGRPVFDGDTPKRDPVIDHAHPNGGVSWAGHFYEVYQWNWNETTLSAFRNLLHVSYAVGTDTVKMAFSLSRSLESTMGFDRLGGGIDVDDGGTDAIPWDKNGKRPWTPSASSPVPTWWKVTCSKRLRFTDRTDSSIGIERPFDMGQILNYLTPALVAMFLEVAVKEGACVRIPPNPST